MNHYYALILAGGGGTRLWPMSRKAMPKQLLPLIQEHSMFHTSVERLDPLFTPDRIFVSTGPEYVDALHAEAPEIPIENFIVEPHRRNSGPATGLAMAIIEQRDPEAVVAILTADHHIARTELFREVLSAAHTLAQQDYIVTLGISPTFPSTGFGYIRQGEPLETVNEFTAYVSRGFTEKPDVVKATQFVRSGQYSWNSGMFIWKASRAMAEFQRQQPYMHARLLTLQKMLGTPDFDEQLKSAWDVMPKLSIDYAIMEGARKMAVIPVDIGWSDVGSWESLYDMLPVDKFGNCSKGDDNGKRLILDTRNTLVFSDRMTVTIGVEDLIIVDAKDALLICRKSRAQDVREIVDYLRANGNDDYL